MKNRKFLWLILAGCLLVAGAILLGVAVTAVDYDFMAFNTQPYETKTYEVEDPFESISIRIDTSDLTFLPSDDGVCRVQCAQTDKLGYRVEVVDGTLTVEISDNRHWTDYIGISWGEEDMIVYLPGDAYKSLFVETDAGDVEIPEVFRFEDLTVEARTADIDCRAQVSGTLEVRTTTGEITLEGNQCKRLAAQSDTGDIVLKNITAEELSAKADTGVVELENCRSSRISVETNTGDVTFENCACGQLRVLTDTGDVTFESCDGGSVSVVTNTGDVTFEDFDGDPISVKTDTGDVTGSLRTEKIFITQSSTGGIWVPRGTSGGLCEITTSTGDIKIRIG